MRLARGLVDDEIVVGVVVDDRLADLRSSDADMIDLLVACRTDAGRAEIADRVARATSIPMAELQLLPPIARPERILCVGTNYHAHVAESDSVTQAPDFPMIFTRFASSLVGADEPIVRPRVSSSFDYEGELAVVIGTEVRDADPDAARAAIAGYSCFMDGTIRDFQRHTSQFTPGKNFDRSGSWGPWIVTADEVADADDLRLETVLDGETVQSASTSQLIFGLGEIISYCSTFTTLSPGDVIATGTPGGVGYARTPPLWLHPGSELTVRISGVGSLSNTVIDGASRVIAAHQQQGARHV